MKKRAFAVNDTAMISLWLVSTSRHIQQKRNTRKLAFVGAISYDVTANREQVDARLGQGVFWRGKKSAEEIRATRASRG